MMQPRTIREIAKAEPRVAALIVEANAHPKTADAWGDGEKLVAKVSDIFEDDDTIDISDYYTVKLHVIDTLAAKEATPCPK